MVLTSVFIIHYSLFILTIHSALFILNKCRMPRYSLHKIIIQPASAMTIAGTGGTAASRIGYVKMFAQFPKQFTRRF
jgi:hypothetical protein